MRSLHRMALISLACGLAVIISSQLALGQISPGSSTMPLPLPPLWIKLSIVTCIAIGGLLGGFLFSISKKRGLELPRPYVFADTQGSTPKGYSLGFLGDLCVGLGGGILIFLLVPFVGDENLLSSASKAIDAGDEVYFLLKILATAMVGGFAGISLFDEAAKRLTQQVQQLEMDLKVKSEAIDSLNEASHQEATVQFLLNRYLDPSLSPLSAEQVRDLNSTLLQATVNTRNWVFQRLQRTLERYGVIGQNLSGPDLEIHGATLKQLIPLLQVLQQAADHDDGDRNSHRYGAHIGFCQEQLAIAAQAQGNTTEAESFWLAALASLDQAIARRDQSGDLEHLFWHYDLHRAMCLYELNNKSQAEQELGKLKPIWLQKRADPGVINSLLKSLDPAFRQWVISLDPALFKSPALGVSSSGNGSGGFPPPQRDDSEGNPAVAVNVLTDNRDGKETVHGNGAREGASSDELHDFVG